MKIKERWEKFEAENSKFGAGIFKPTKRPDLTAFILLDKLVPGVIR